MFNKYNYTLPQLKPLTKSEIDLLLYLSEQDQPIIKTNKEIGLETGWHIRTIGRGIVRLRELGFLDIGYQTITPYIANRSITILNTDE